jgi:hypothetical protein
MNIVASSGQYMPGDWKLAKLEDGETMSVPSDALQKAPVLLEK